MYGRENLMCQMKLIGNYEEEDREMNLFKYFQDSSNVIKLFAYIKFFNYFLLTTNAFKYIRFI